MPKISKELSNKAKTSPESGQRSAKATEGERPRSEKLVQIGTLNVGSLTGKYRGVADLMMRRNIQVPCLQENRIKRANAREIEVGVKHFYNGEDPKRNGVTMAVAESLEGSV
uniref:EEP domain-containing protein n=1 Tax=Haemonchus contortus TaxID=6289 RepID=A0A7I4Y3Z0_HAECO